MQKPSDTKKIVDEIAEIVAGDFADIDHLNELLYHKIWNRLPGNAQDCIGALFIVGPLWDGDVPSKNGRDVLIEHGLAFRTVVKGKEGYQALTMPAVWLWKAFCRTENRDFMTGKPNTKSGEN